jgi:hypothetical protein
VRPQKSSRMWGVFDRELVTRVTRLGYEIRYKIVKRGAFFQSSLEKGTFLKLLANTSRKKGYILSSQNLKLVQF